MSVPLACEVTEDLLDDGLSKFTVLRLIVSEAEVLVTGFDSKLCVRFFKLILVVFDFFFLALLGSLFSVLGSWAVRRSLHCLLFAVVGRT